MRGRLAVGIRYGLLVSAGLLLARGLALAQGEEARAGQAVRPQLPTFQRRPVPAPPPPPFVLGPQEQADVDRLLDAWERRGKEVRTFECSFARWEYDATFPGKPSKENPHGAKWIDQGTIKYAAPDKGFFKAEGYLTENRKVTRQEQWICDGKSVFSYDWVTRVLTEYQLPPEAQGKAIVDGPLPFLFGAEAAKLKQRYYIRLITPGGVQGEIWLEAYPRFQREAADFQCAQLILKTKELVPSAMQIYFPGGKNRRSYQFNDVLINDSDPLRNFFKENPFQGSKPLGWTKVVKPPESPAQASRPPLTGR